MPFVGLQWDWDELWASVLFEPSLCYDYIGMVQMTLTVVRLLHNGRMLVRAVTEPALPE